MIETTFAGHEGYVLLRRLPKLGSPAYMEALHKHEGGLFQGVCAYTPGGTVTLSIVEPLLGVSCLELAQHLWGPRAEGDLFRASSPREYCATEEDWRQAAILLNIDICGALIVG